MGLPLPGHIAASGLMESDECIQLCKGIMLVPMNSCLTNYPPKLPGPWAGRLWGSCEQSCHYLRYVTFTQSKMSPFSFHAIHIMWVRSDSSVILREEQLS